MTCNEGGDTDCTSCDSNNPLIFFNSFT